MPGTIHLVDLTRKEGPGNAFKLIEYLFSGYEYIE